MLVTEMTETVTNILKLSSTYFVSNIRHQHRCCRLRTLADFFVKQNAYRYKDKWALFSPIEKLVILALSTELLVMLRQSFKLISIVKGSSDQSYFIVELNVGKRRIRHRTTLNLNDAISIQF